MVDAWWEVEEGIEGAEVISSHLYVKLCMHQLPLYHTAQGRVSRSAG